MLSNGVFQSVNDSINSNIKIIQKLHSVSFCEHSSLNQLTSLFQCQLIHRLSVLKN